MTRKADTQVRITDTTWAELNAKKRPGDSFDDVIQRLLDEAEEDEEGNGMPLATTAD